MLLEGDFTVQAAREKAYGFLVDPEQVGNHLPDVEELDVENHENFTVKAKVGVSYIKGSMVMKLQILDKEPPVSAKVVGKGSGLASVVDMTTHFKLEEVGAGETKIHWSGEVAVGGKLASFGGGGLLERVAKKNLEKFVAGIKAGIEAMDS
ncbi:MAG: SRPBCC domain-containing protein [Acidobacteriota bacterium]|nr:SRPBCC domain-containing protein [Acidobacteriota bacterium]